MITLKRSTKKGEKQNMSINTRTQLVTEVKDPFPNQKRFQKKPQTQKLNVNSNYAFTKV